jgi:hypothetical protein
MLKRLEDFVRYAFVVVVIGSSAQQRSRHRDWLAVTTAAS